MWPQRGWWLQILRPLPLFFPLLRCIWEEHTLLGVQTQGWLCEAELGSQQALHWCPHPPPPQPDSFLLCASWSALPLP